MLMNIQYVQIHLDFFFFFRFYSFAPFSLTSVFTVHHHRHYMEAGARWASCFPDSGG